MHNSVRYLNYNILKEIKDIGVWEILDFRIELFFIKNIIFSGNKLMKIYESDLIYAFRNVKMSLIIYDAEILTNTKYSTKVWIKIYIIQSDTLRSATLGIKSI